MPYEYLVDHGRRLVVVRGTGEGSLEELFDSARRLFEDGSIGSDYHFMIVVDDIAFYPTLEEMSSIVSLIGAMRSRFRGRIAIVAARPDRVITSKMVALAANGVFGKVQAFTNEGSARVWLFADTPPERCESEDILAPGA